jgi:flagellar biosynthetic protein FliQ
MDAGQVVTVARQTIWVIVKTSVPLLLVSMIVGLIISLFQTLTSIQEQTLTFVPKLLAIMIALMIMGNWLLNEIVYADALGKLWSVYMMAG